MTANRCRITPATAWIAPSAEQDQRPLASAWLSWSTIPFWIARPIANGISACASIQQTPKNTPPSSVGSCWRPTQSRKRAGDRVSGTPGSEAGSTILIAISPYRR